MARTLTPQDCHELMNLLQAEAIGKDNSIQVVDSSTFVSAGEKVLASGIENTINTLYMLAGRLYVASRKYRGKLGLITAISSGAYSDRLLKISTYSKKAQAAGQWNTDLYTNLAPGYTSGENGGASVKSQWEQNPPVNLEVNFGGRSVYDFSITIYEDQLKQAFRNEGEFAKYWAGVMQEFANDLEQYKEDWNRLAIINRICADYDMVDLRGDETVVDLIAEFNKEFDTTYTRKELLTTYIKEFLEFLVARLKIDTQRLTERTVKYHWNPTKTVGGVEYDLLRHTPYSKQKFIVHSHFWTKAKAYVLPEIFNENRLSYDNFEEVSYWQNFNDPTAVKGTPAINDENFAQIKGDAVDLPYVFGILFDDDAVVTDFQIDYVRSTPVEARKGYRNIWYGFARNICSDATENSIIYILGEGGANP